jgi:precorrin-6B methylase 2
MKLEAAKTEFVALIDKLGSSDVGEFLQWIGDSFSCSKEECSESQEEDLVMQQIVGDLKQHLTPNGILASETIIWPTDGVDSDCEPASTVSVDSFLYGCDEDIDEMCERGDLSRNYCLDCGSKRTKPLTFISHSASLAQLRFIFERLLPPLNGKNVLDVGSRLGAVVYGAYLYNKSNCQIVGVEMNERFCQLQQAMLAKYGMGDRCHIIFAKVEQSPRVVATADVIVLNNVFQFFQSAEQQKIIWQSIHDNTRAGQYIVSIPAVEEVTAHLTLPFTITSWLRKIDTEHLLRKVACEDEDKLEEVSRICLYEVV